MVHENLRPSDIMTKAAFENAVVAAAALGASSNCPIHMVAIARHMGVDHTLDDWQRLGPDIPLLVDCSPPAASWASASTAPAACPRCCANCWTPASCTATR